MAQMPIFGAGNYQNILNAISKGTISYPAWMYCRDRQMLGFVEPDGSFVLMKGDNKKSVEYVNELPEIGDTDILYISAGIAYTYDGEKFNQLGKDYSEELTALDSKVTTIEGKVKALEDIAHQVVDTSELEGRIETLEKTIEEIEVCSCDGLYETIKYEVSYKPVGTLVDYREKEIRIMCSDDKFELQQSGENADANKYYIGIKAYAPSEDIVGFKEAIDKTISDDTMYYFENNEFAGVNADGRKYSIIWLPVAIFENNVWTYYGDNSSIEHYVGWYYSVEWYDANGVVVASDCIKINLSNKACHYAVEPYYILEVKAEVEALKESNADVVEKLSTITDQVIEIEERVEIVEKETFTFVELE